MFFFDIFSTFFHGIDRNPWPMGPSQVYRGAVEFRRAEVLSMERLERLGGSAAELPAPEAMKGGRAKSLRPLSALKMPRCKVGRSW